MRSGKESLYIFFDCKAVAAKSLNFGANINYVENWIIGYNRKKLLHKFKQTHHYNF